MTKSITENTENLSYDLVGNQNMSLNNQQTAEVLAKYQRKASDTGSPEVQIALWSAKIKYLTNHFQAHKKDLHSRRGLLKMVSKRRKLLDYLKRVNSQAYNKLIADLGLRN